MASAGEGEDVPRARDGGPGHAGRSSPRAESSLRWNLLHLLVQNSDHGPGSHSLVLSSQPLPPTLRESLPALRSGEQGASGGLLGQHHVL